jgi:hypothetical protein
MLAPSLGAAIYAARLAGQPFSPAAIERLRNGNQTRHRLPLRNESP